MQHSFRIAFLHCQEFRSSERTARSLFCVLILSGSLICLTSQPVRGQSGSRGLVQQSSDIRPKTTLGPHHFDSSTTDRGTGRTFVQNSYILCSSASELSAPERSALAARRQIKTIELKIRQQLRTVRGDDVKVANHRIRCVVDGASRKCERLSELQTEVTCVGNRDLDGHVTLVDTRETGATSSVVIALAKGHEKYARQSVLDPRALGLLASPSPHVARNGMDYFSPYTDRTTTEVNRVNFRGEQCECVTFQLNSGIKIKTWICPRMKHAVLRVEAHATRDELSILESVDTEMDFHKRSDTWFPTQVKYSITHDGRRIGAERLEIEVVSINEEIPESEFQLSSFPGLHEGSRISKVAADGATKTAYWRDGKISDWEELD